MSDIDITETEPSEVDVEETPETEAPEAEGSHNVKQLRDAYDRLRFERDELLEQVGEVGNWQAELDGLRERTGKQEEFIRNTVFGELGIPARSREVVEAAVDSRGVEWTDTAFVQAAIEAAGLDMLIGQERTGGPPPRTAEEWERIGSQERTQALMAAGFSTASGPASPDDETVNAIARGDIADALKAQTSKLNKHLK